MYRPMIVFTLVASGLLGAGCTDRRDNGSDSDPRQGISAPEPAPPQERLPNVVLLTIDTLRADTLSNTDEYPHDTTPFLRTLSQQSVRFDNAYAPSPWTVPSMVSMHTAVHPRTHGITKASFGKEKIVGQRIVPPAVTTWAESMQDLGYRTLAVVTNNHMTAELGFAQGFDTYRHLGWNNRSDIVVGNAIRLLNEQPSSPKPYFLWVHLFDPHSPYEPRKPWIKTLHPDYASEAERLGVAGSLTAGRIERNPSLLDLGRKLYDSEIRAVDSAIEKLLGAIDANSEHLLLLAADHGEEFLEHGMVGHSHQIYAEAVRIPLLIRFPQGAHGGATISALASLMDLMPTALAYLGDSLDPELHGVNLLPLLSGKESTREMVLSVGRNERFRFIGLVDRKGWKLVYDENTHARQLFHVTTDPGEEEDIATREDRRVTQLAQRLHEKVRIYSSSAWKHEDSKVHTFSEKELEALKAMGYVSE
jgi:arylsulfatase A-like enzyme